MIVNAAAIPFQVFIWIGKMFSCIPFGAKLDCYSTMTMIPGLSEKISIVENKFKIQKKGRFSDENRLRLIH